MDKYLSNPKINTIVRYNSKVTILVPTRHYAGIKGNVLVITNRHFENIFDIDCSLGNHIFKAIQDIAVAMKRCFKCDGISIRQHNEPAGNQDVWHFHVHVFPRYDGDNLHKGKIGNYSLKERVRYASILRAALNKR